MVDREKVIKALELEIKNTNSWECMKECPYYGKTECDCYTQVSMDALELLKEQKPLVIQKDVVDEVYDYIAECPECGMTWAMWHPDRMRYCTGCGKRVKWNDAGI